jgi:hypothetical protein
VVGVAVLLLLGLGAFPLVFLASLYLASRHVCGFLIMFLFFFVPCRTHVLLVLALSTNSIYFSLLKKKKQYRVDWF